MRAGFDGVEIHGANGYLIDQLLQDMSNNRMDEYGGSVQNRIQFALEVTKEVVDAVGEDRVGFRISPWGTSQELEMPDPIPQFTHLAQSLKSAHSNSAERSGDNSRLARHDLQELELRFAKSNYMVLYPNPSNDFLRRIWAPKVFISAGGYSRETALEITEKEGNEVVAFGRHFLANPDLPKRLEQNLPLNKYSRSRFYIPAEAPEPERGYIICPFCYISAAEEGENKA